MTLSPDKGTVTRANNIVIRYLAQAPDFHKDATVLEAVMEGNCRHDNEWSLESDARTMLQRLGISEYGQKVDTMSGGQRKRIALASTLLSKADVLVLDEPSSNLDPEAEHDIFENLKILTDGKLTIFTSHRLSNVFLADKIIVLENGQIVEMGTQRQLLENKNRYAELFRYQSEKFVQEGCGQNDSGCGN